MESVRDTAMPFVVGHAEEFDRIVLGIKLDLHLPFLNEDVWAILNFNAEETGGGNLRPSHRSRAEPGQLAEPAPRPAVWSPRTELFWLEGPDALPDTPARFACEAAAFGAITSNERTRALTGLLAARGNSCPPIRRPTCRLHTCIGILTHRAPQPNAVKADE
ncbi:hypothetical protein ABFA25_10280 [Mycobacterium lepromatosis]|nr:hypothetical protein [Mycobacterium lepromatosis]